MSNSDDLKNIGLKATIPRLTILALFERTEVRHLTAEDVYRLLLAEHLDIGPGHRLSRPDPVRAGGAARTPLFRIRQGGVRVESGQHHDHLVCIDCGRVEEFYDAEIERRQTKVATDRGFVIREHALYLYAECRKPECPHRRVSPRNPGEQTTPSPEGNRHDR
jgi:Fur family ferric uptake transcriptional regulator